MTDAKPRAAKRTTRRPARVRTNVPDVASSFVGRAADLAALTPRLANPRMRLVTLTGPGGIGKTRLAIRVADAWRDAPVWFCDLTEARSAVAMATSVASTLGIRFFESDEAAMIEELGVALADRGPLLLVLDNLEQVIDEARPVVGAWLRAAPDAYVLATSRVALDLAGEELWPLSPLSASEASDLFLTRARQVRPDLETTRVDLEAVSTIVRTLEGMPLAIELAASRMDVMSPAQLSARLEPSLDLLTRPKHPGRHASVRQTVLDSVQLLTADERACFVACAIFRDGFALEAAEAVIAPSTSSSASSLAPPSTMDRLAALTRSSLLRARPSRALDGEMRFSFFVAIREVATEQLAALPMDERDGLSTRHARHYAAEAKALGAEVSRHGGRAAREALGLDLDNFLAAYDRALLEAKREPSGEAVAHTVAIALGLEPLLAQRGLTRLRLRLLEGALDALEMSRPRDRATLAEALLAHGQAMRELANFPRAKADFAAALPLALDANVTRLIALSHARMGELVELTGATEEAHVHFAKALAALAINDEAAADRRADAEVRIRVAHAYRREGNLAAAAAAIAGAISRYRTLEEDEGLAAALYEAAVIAMFQGRNAVARSYFDEGLLLARRSEAPLLLGTLMTARASMLQGEGATDEAIAEHAEAARLFRELGSRYRETSALYYLATAHLECGERARANALLLQAREKARGIGSPHYQALIESALSVVLRLSGHLDESSAAFTRAEEARALCATEQALVATVAIHGLTLELQETNDQMVISSKEQKARALANAHPSDDSHFALRLFAMIAGLTPTQARLALVVTEDGAAFRLPGSRASVELSTRPLLRRILALLVRRRRESAGAPVAIAEIVEQAWPGERMVADAAANRVHVALATLRKLGLRDALKSGGGAYWLDPSLALRVAASVAAV